jgi:Helix-turn-helix family
MDLLRPGRGRTLPGRGAARGCGGTSRIRRRSLRATGGRRRRCCNRRLRLDQPRRCPICVPNPRRTRAVPRRVGRAKSGRARRAAAARAGHHRSARGVRPQTLGRGRATAADESRILRVAPRHAPARRPGAVRLARGQLPLREWRGDTHWALLLAAGLSHAEASILHNAWLGYEGDWLANSRGTSPADLDASRESLQARGPRGTVGCCPGASPCVSKSKTTRIASRCSRGRCWASPFP